MWGENMSHPWPCDILILPAGRTGPDQCQEVKTKLLPMCFFSLSGLDSTVIRKHGLVPQAPGRRLDLCPGALVGPGPDTAPPGLFSHLQNNLASQPKHDPLPPRGQLDLGIRPSSRGKIPPQRGVEECGRSKKKVPGSSMAWWLQQWIPHG